MTWFCSDAHSSSHLHSVGPLKSEPVSGFFFAFVLITGATPSLSFPSRLLTISSARAAKSKVGDSDAGFPSPRISGQLAVPPWKDGMCSLKLEIFGYS